MDRVRPHVTRGRDQIIPLSPPFSPLFPVFFLAVQLIKVAKAQKTVVVFQQNEM